MFPFARCCTSRNFYYFVNKKIGENSSILLINKSQRSPCTYKSGHQNIKITRRTTTSERKQVCASNSKFQIESIKKESNRYQVNDSEL